MDFQQAAQEEFFELREFYWALIDRMEQGTIGWKKGVYPSDDMLRTSLSRGEVYTLREAGTLCACVILNSACNDGYEGVLWSRACKPEEVLVPHALAVDPAMQGRGVGKRLVARLLELARADGKKAVRLDILGTNRAAEALYRRMGFSFVAEKRMFYEDTGWTEYRMFEYNLQPLG